VGRVTSSNVQVVRSLFEGYRRDGIDGVLATMDANVFIEIPGDLSAEPDEYRGHDGVRRYFDGFAGMIEDVRYDPLELIEVGDCVVAHIRLSGRGSNSGVGVDMEAFVLHVLANGRIVRMRPYADLESALEAAAG
jgi:ketosteroid isomerase-like protein